MSLKARIKKLERAYDPGISPAEALARFHTWCRILWDEIELPGQDPWQYQRDPASNAELETLAFQHEKKRNRTTFTSLPDWQKHWMDQLSI